MFLYIILIFVAQICCCAAHSTCLCLPNYAVCVMGITIITLIMTTIALGIYVCRLKRDIGSEVSVYEVNRNASMFQYEPQISENSQRISCGNDMDKEMLQLNTSNEHICNGNNRDNNYSKARVENSPKIIRIQTKVPISPQMNKDQLDAICEAVKSQKESTSLSDLDKIINDAKAQSTTLDISASTPALDFYDHLSSPVQVKKVKKLPTFDADSKESKLREEIMAKFNNDIIQANENVDEMNIKLKDGKINSVDHEKNHLKLDQDEIKLKLIHHEMMTKTIRNELKSKLNQCNINKKSQSKASQSIDETEAIDKETVQDEIYDLPPPLRPQTELYDVLPSPKGHSKSPSTSSLLLENELYERNKANLPSSPKPHIEWDNIPSSPKQSNEIYDFPHSPKRHDEINEIQPSTKSHDEVYEIVPTTRNKNRVVSDGNDTGYLLPMSDDALADESQYSNAKTPPNQNSL